MIATKHAGTVAYSVAGATKCARLNPMGRPREFDEVEVLDRAMKVFWRRGYAAASTRELTEAMGVAPSALYRTWGDKHGLFLNAIDRYAVNQVSAFAEHVDRPGTTPDILRAWVLHMVEEIADDPDGKGCLMVNIAAELGTGDREAAERARAAFGVLRQAIEDVIRRGQQRRDLAPTVDAPAASELLLSTVLGLRVRARAGEPKTALEQSVEAALTMLTPAP